MTVLMREELNDVDLAWAAIGSAAGSGTDPLLRPREALGAEPLPRPTRHEKVVDPAVLRAWGGL